MLSCISFSQSTIYTSGETIYLWSNSQDKYINPVTNDDKSIFWFSEKFTRLEQKGGNEGKWYVTNIVKNAEEGSMSFTAIDGELSEYFFILQLRESLLKIIFEYEGKFYLFILDITLVEDNTL